MEGKGEACVGSAEVKPSKHGCVSIQAFQGEFLILLSPGASQGTETGWGKKMDKDIFEKIPLGPSPIFNKEKHLLCSQ